MEREENTSFEIPEILITAQQNQMVENLKNNVKSQFQIDLKDYLEKIKKTEKEVQDSFLKEAKKMVKNSIILREIARKENIQVKKDIDLDKVRSYYEGIIRDEKIFQLLE